MSKVTFGYWKIRGLGQFIRHLLAYTGTDFKEVQYESPDKWFKEDKFSLGLDFPNLPYLVDGDFKLTESIAVAKYVIKRSGKNELLGKNTQDEGKVNALVAILREVMGAFIGLCFNPDHENLKIELLEKHRPKLNYVKEFIGDKQFALGYLTLVDFYLAEQLAYFEALFPSEHKNFGFWWRIRHNFDQIAEIKAYYQRADAMVGPYLPPSASLNPSGKKVKLCYWPVRGLGQVNRLLLSFFKVDFEDYKYTDYEQWFKKDKLHLGLDFPNLPYLIDGEYNLTESTAIQTYIIKKWGNPELLGKDIKDNARIEAFLSIFNEIQTDVRGLFFNKEHATAKGPLLEKFKPKLDQLESFIGKNDFSLGYLTILDFVVAEFSNYIETVWPEESKAWSFLKRIRANFNKLPEVEAYYKSENSFKGRFYPESAVLAVEKA